MSCIEGKREENFKNTSEMLSDHKTKTAIEFIVLPELFAIGFRYTDYNEVGPGVPGPTAEFIQNLAEEHSAYVVGTDIEQTGKKYFNTLVMASPKGKIVAEYRKMHPFQSEKDVFAGGESLVIVEIGGIKVGLEICYDVRFPEITRTLALNGAELVLIPAAFPDPRAQHWDTLVRARAIENQIYVAATNRMGWAFDNKTYFGHSQIVDPWGVVLNRLNTDMTVFSNKGDTDMISEVRNQITCFQDRTPDYYDSVTILKE
jgi:predicted amidohydrolase